MIYPADASLATAVPLIVLAVTTAGGVLTWWANGVRSERTRLQTLYADAYVAVVSYQEFPFMIRRRRAPLSGSEGVANDERVRIAAALQGYVAFQCRHSHVTKGVVVVAQQVQSLVLCGTRQ